VDEGIMFGGGIDSTQFRVGVLGGLPSVAAGRQRWAGWFNPVGIARRADDSFGRPLRDLVVFCGGGRALKHRAIFGVSLRDFKRCRMNAAFCSDVPAGRWSWLWRRLIFLKIRRSQTAATGVWLLLSLIRAFETNL